MISVLYQALKTFVGIFFNLLNVLLGGNLPPFGCVCLVVKKEQRFLVLERPNGNVVFPGGFIRWRERPEETAVREGREETGLQLQPKRVVSHYPIVSRSFTRMSTLNIVYEAEAVGGELSSSIEGRAYWMHEDELVVKLSSFYLGIFQEYQRYSGQRDNTE